MERRRMRKKPSFKKRMMVTMLSLAMLLSMFSPGLMASADDTVVDPTQETTSFMDSFTEAFDQQTQSGSETLGSLALSYIAKYDVLKTEIQALDAAAEDYAALVEALNAKIAALDAAIAADAANGNLTADEVTGIRAAAVGSVTAAAPAAPVGGEDLKTKTVTDYANEMTFAVTGKLPEGVTLSVQKLDDALAAFIRSEVLGLGALPAGYTGAAYDIKLMKDGAEIQPAEAVTLGVTADGITSKADVAVYHLPGTSADSVAAASAIDLHGLTGSKIEKVNCYDQGYYAFFTNGFSVYYVSTGNLYAEVDEAEGSAFYNQLMAAESCQAIFELMMADTDACLQLTAEELVALKEKVISMEDDGYQVEVLETIVYLGEQLLGCTCGAAEGAEHDTSCPMYAIGYYIVISNYRWTDVSVQAGDKTNILNGTSVSSASCKVYDENGNEITNSGISVSKSQKNNNWRIEADDNTSAGTYYVVVTYNGSQTAYYKVTVTNGNQGGTGSGYLDLASYDSTDRVYWDTTTGTASASGGSQSGTHISSLTLDNKSVTWTNSGSPSIGSGTQLSTYFPAGSTTVEDTADLVITADSGYYVTGIIVCCGHSNGTEPYSCQTWGNGAAFVQDFNLTQSVYDADTGKYTLSVTLSNKYFSHKGTSSNSYYILVKIATVPTPLYVEYNYGNVTDFLTVDSKSAFYSPTWTVAGSNNYGTGGVYTTDTQFAYGYETNNTSAIANWKHTANTISAVALAEAAAAGYYFTGWAVTWYNNCTVSDADNAYRDSYTMTFSDVYMNGSYQPGASVQLPTHVRLVAQWAPISLKVTKTVSGLSSITEFANKSQTYTLVLQKLGTDEYVTLQTKDYTITGDGTLTYTFAAKDADVTQAITPGTYKVVETGTYDLTGSSENAYCTTTYPIETVEVAADGTVKELQVLNTYSSTPSTYDLTVKKTVSGNMGDINKEFEFTVKYGEVTETFYLKNDGTTTVTGIPVGSTVTVTEDPDGYTYSFVSITEGVTKTDTTNGVSFIMPAQDVTVVINNENDVTIDTGVNLNSFPFIMMLSSCIVMAVFFLIGKKRMMF